MSFLAQIVAWINIFTNVLGKFLFGPIAVLPGWLSNTIISAVMGLVIMIALKYTSNQDAIGRVRNNIKANMLALKLFKDSMRVTLHSQGQLFKGAFLLLFHAIRPMLVMALPISLLVAQMGLWYQSRPLQPGEEALVVMQLNGQNDSPWPEVRLEPTSVAEVTIDKTRVFSKRQIFWKIKAKELGRHHIIFNIDDKQVEKELIVGDGFMRLSAIRPGWKLTDIMWNPAEKPFGPDSVVQSIIIEYPDRLSRTSGTNWWVIYFFITSFIFALIFKPILKVKI